MTGPVKIGVVGCARIVRRAIVGAATRTAAVELTVIASSRPGVAEFWARELNIPRSYSDYASIIADPEVTAVYLPLPNEQHREWSIRAAEAGKHVLCEKPLARDAAEAEEMVRACERRGVVLMEAFMWRHHPRVAHCAQQVIDGRLGQLRLVKLDFSFQLAGDDWRLDPARGGGALYDLGCYGINAARFFTVEEPVEVIARARMSDTGVDKTAAVTLRFATGVLALLDCSFESPDRNRLEIVGTEGIIVLRDGVLPGSSGEVIQRGPDGEEKILFENADQYAAQFEAFANAIARGQLTLPAEDGLANMRVLDSARRNAWG